MLALTLARLANAPGQASIALGGVLASFSLMVAMGIMVASFRVSVDDWMLHILPADLYVRSGRRRQHRRLRPGRAGGARRRCPASRAAAFLRTRPLSLDPGAARPSR